MSNESPSIWERVPVGSPEGRAPWRRRRASPVRARGEAKGAPGRSRPGVGVGVGAAALGAAFMLGATACSGIDAGVVYPDDLPSDIDRQLVTPENQQGPSVTLGKFKISPEACKGIDTHPITQALSPEDLTRFLEAQGAGSIAPKQARSNLFWFDFPSKDKTFVRLRLAVLDRPDLATKDLHDALLQHGPGWWGVRRSNLAVLAPKASLDTALAFALKYKLVCWGVFTYAGNDDAYVVPGPYAEL